MSDLPDPRTGEVTASPVSHQDRAVVRLDDGQTFSADAALVGGRRRWSVGGEYAEGPRWWRGELSVEGAPALPHAGAAIEVQLSNGRTAAAIVERSSTEHFLRITGVGAPPFEVP